MSFLHCSLTPADRASDSVPVHYSSVVCNGTEDTLEECATDRGGFANHVFDAFIVCSPSDEISQTQYSGEPGSCSADNCDILLPIFHADIHTPGPNAGDIRLLGSPDNGAGAVEIYTDNVGWTGICPDSSWTSEDAGVVCRALGYDSGVAQTFE